MTIPPEAAAVAVKSTTGLLTAAGVWAGVIMLGLVLLIAVVKIMPKMKELRIGEKRGELDDLRERIVALETKVEEANRHADLANEKSHRSEMKLMAAVSAFQLVTTDLRKHDPDSPALRQAQELMSMAATGDFGMDRALKALGAVNGVGV